MQTRRSLAACIVVALCLEACTRTESAPPQPAGSQIRNPAEAPIQRPSAAAPRPGARATAVGREATLTLKVALTTTTIRNPATQQLDQVKLRAYQSAATDPSAPLVAPTIRVSPGETVRLTIQNDLDEEAGCAGADPNTPHCFNTTNIHAHGLWVSPTGNSDNVFTSIRPKVTFEYEYNIPSDHPAGTYWYHPHHHGSTALQVASGMAGALIVQGSRLPTESSRGDIDTLLRNPDGSPFAERVLVFQQIPYACRDENRNIKRNADNTWRCDAGDRGEVDQYDDLLTLGPAWKRSGRFTTINGRTVEPLAQHALVGQLERWRMIHAGIRATIRVQFRKRLPSSTPFAAVSALGQDAWIAANCDPAQVPVHWELAADGLTRDQLAARTSTFLQPGYRSDLLVLFPTAGDYCVIDEAAPAPATVNGSGRQLLTVVTVDGTTAIADPAAYVKDHLKTAARAFMPAGVRQRVEDDLENGLHLSSFVPHEDLGAATPANTRKVVFQFLPPAVGDGTTDPKPYDPTRIDRELTLGDIDDWTITTIADGGAPHPFHIHVNPFQVLSVINAAGADLTEDQTSEYWNMKGVWKDTLLVENDVTVTVRTRYRRYVGDFVLHCHILDHEDRGMMQNIRILLPGDQGAHTSHAH